MDPNCGDAHEPFTLDHECAAGQTVPDIQLDGDALAGDDRRVEFQRVRVDHDPVRRDPISRRQERDVISDEFGCRELALLAVSTNQHSARDHVLHRCCRVFCLPLLGEGEDSIDDHDESDGEGELR